MTLCWKYAVLTTLLISSCQGKHDDPHEYDTIVVGLGAAGAVAASILARAGKKVLGLEALERVGGRVCTEPFGDGVVEIGAEWIHGTKNSFTYKTATEHNVTILPQDTEYIVKRSDGEPVAAVVKDIIQYAVDYNDDKPDKAEPFEDFFNRRLMKYIKEKTPEVYEDKKLLKQIMDYTRREAVNIWGAYELNDLNAADAYEGLEGNQAMSWQRNGYKTFFDIVLNKYKDGPGLPSLDMKLNTVVTKIEWPQENDGKVSITIQDGTVYKADNVIITIPLGVLKEKYKILFSPSLPQEKITAIEKLQMGLIGKVILSFPSAWWPSNVTYAFLWDADDLKKIDPEDMWTTKLTEVSTPMGSTNTLTFWTSGDLTKQVENIPEEILKNKTMEILRRFLGTITTIPEPTGLIRSRWFRNKFARGTYSYDSMKSADLPSARSDLGAPLLDAAGKPRVLFAGEATHPTQFSTVHGAADTGNREAMRLLEASHQH